MADTESTPLLNSNSNSTILEEEGKPRRSVIGELWLESRKLEPGTKLNEDEDDEDLKELGPNQFKPLSMFYYKIAFRLGRIVIWPFFKRIYNIHPYLAPINVISVLLEGLTPTLEIIVAAKILDQVQHSLLTGDPNLPRIITLAAILLVISMADLLISWIGTLCQAQLQRTLMADTACRLYSAKLVLDMPGMQEPYRRDILEAATIFGDYGNAIDRRGNTTMAGTAGMIYSINKIIINSVSFCSATFLLFSTMIQKSGNGRDFLIQAALVVIAMIPSTLSLLSSFGTVHSQRNYNFVLYRRKWALEDMSGLQHRKEVSIYHLQDWLVKEWSRMNNLLILERPLMGHWLWMKEISSSVGKPSVTSFFQILLAARAFPTSITLGSAQLLQSVANQFISAVESMHKVAEEQYQNIFFLAAFEEALSLEPLVKAEDSCGKQLERSEIVPYKSMIGPDGASGMKIEARNLSFKYPGADKYALTNINFIAWPGQTVAIVGFNGGGKTTLLQILLRLYDYEGELFFNDIEARRYDPADLHSHMAASFQEFSKLPVSLRDNITVGDLSKKDDDAAINLALLQGGVNDFLPELPFGLDTNLNLAPEARRKNKKSKKSKYEKAHPEQSLSGGQWRRVALARAFFKVPTADLCAFDEPSDSLDARAAHDVFEKIANLSKNEEGKKVKTTIFITHQFATVKQADVIAVFEKGTIVEFGVHSDLMAIEGGVYNEFYTLQSQAFN